MDDEYSGVSAPPFDPAAVGAHVASAVKTEQDTEYAYHCDDGHTLNPQDVTLRCKADGQWDIQPPTPTIQCQRI